MRGFRVNATIFFSSSSGETTWAIAEAQQKVELLNHTRLVFYDLVFLQAPGNARRFGEKLANVITIRTEHLVFVRENALEIQAIRFLKGLFQQRNGTPKPIKS